MHSLLIALFLFQSSPNLAPQACRPHSAPEAFQDCLEGLDQHPDDENARMCVFDLAQRTGQWSQGLIFLERCFGAQDTWARLVQGHISLFRNDGRRDYAKADEYYNKALDLAVEEQSVMGEVRSLLNLASLSQYRGRPVDRLEYLEKAKLRAQSGDDPAATAWTMIAEADYLHERKMLGEAEAILADLDSSIESFRDEALRARYYIVKINLAGDQGRSYEAFDTARHFYQASKEAVDSGRLRPSVMQRNMRILVRAGQFYVSTTRRYFEKDPPPRLEEKLKELIGIAEESLRVAEDINYTGVAENLRVWLGYQKGRMPSPQLRAEGRALLRQVCRGSALEANARQAYAALVESWFREKQPEEAMKVYREAQRRGLMDDQEVRSMWVTHMLVSIEQDDWDKAERLLDQIEKDRERQHRPSNRMGWLAALTDTYLVLAGHALEEAKRTQDFDLKARAFRIIERMRSQVLLEELDAAQALAELQPELNVIEEDIAKINKRLWETELTRQQREALFDEQEALYERKTALRSQAIFQDRPSGESLVSLQQIQGRLQPHQAMLSFQLGFHEDMFGHFAGGAWVMVIHRDFVRAFPTQDVYWLLDNLPYLEGLLEKRQIELGTLPALFYDGYLAEALQALPEGVDELILIPDGSMNRLPFALLTPDPDAPALGERFKLTVTPSATLWSRWSEAPRSRPSSTVLALADPSLARPASDNAEDVRHAPLPYARQEAWGVARYMGESCLIRLGEEASETFVKSPAPRDFQVLHFAAHAVTDPLNPERSAIRLAPGGNSQDGNLEVREIVDLDLQDKLIVLSACQSASGQVILGEGVLGLARAFFQARARVVVGSLWPLRDDDAALLFEAFYRFLGQGRSVGAALQMAQKEAIAQGLPAQAWAGILVMGDGSFVPFPEGVEPRFHVSRSLLSYIGAAVALILFGGAFLLRRRASRPPTPKD
ncbi:MAG TPA: CHAT domain-containing protein [Acidobacteriota bacterium]|nr:CHAT domain-containing protein [Acidobacteriota bacterium]